MRTVLFASVALLSMVGAAAAQEAKQDFKLVNHTGYELREVYVSPSHSDDWQEDILGEGSMADDSSVNIHFHRDTHTCRWDLKVVYTVDSSSAVWSNIDLCSVEKITIHYDKKNDVTRASFD